MLKPIILILVISYLLSGCATDSNQTIFQGTAIGSIVGTGLGYLLDNKDGAKLGFAIGGMVGFVLSQEVAKRKQQYANQEEAINGEIHHAEKQIMELSALNQQLKQNINAYEQDLASLTYEVRMNQITKNDAKADMQLQKNIIQRRESEALKHLTQVQNELKISQQLYKDYHTEGNLVEVEKWKAKITKLELEKNTLEDSINNLVDMALRISLNLRR